MLGDNAYTSGTDAEYQAAVFDMYPTMLRKTRAVADARQPRRRQRELRRADAVRTTTSSRCRSRARPAGSPSGTEAYYSFDYGNIHFICLDSIDDGPLADGGPMLTWLQNDLASDDQPWIIAFWHHPPYSKGSHDSDTTSELIEMRQNALPILEDGGVDLVLSGHSHSYERSFLIDGHYGTVDHVHRVR